MAESAYLLVFVDKATRVAVSAGIFSARHVTMNQNFVALVLHEVTAENYDRALRIMRAHLADAGARLDLPGVPGRAGPNDHGLGEHYAWLRPLWKNFTPFRGE